MLTRRTAEEIGEVRRLLKKCNFPDEELLFRGESEDHKDVAERTMPDVLVEADCSGIGSEVEMTYPHIKPDLKTRIRSIVAKEYGGIDHLPDNIGELLTY